MSAATFLGYEMTKKLIEDYGILTDAPPAPDYLSDGARLEWQRIAPAAVALGTFSGCDVRGLALCCEALAQEAVLREVLNLEGYTIQSGTGDGSKAHPACRL
ncbi:MAG: P27 family phage terminase small subunit, partial [Betaproteobacteria bacterium]|nr:P27 family phage terminase small subunit [Betaproteobacteria bacterium]